MKKWMLLILLLFVVLAGSVIWTEQTLSPLRAQTETAWEAADAAILRRAELVPALTAQTGRYTSEGQDAARAAEEARQRILDASSREARMAAHDELSSALGRLLLAADAYGGPGQDARSRISGYSGREKRNKTNAKKNSRLCAAVLFYWISRNRE